jgi:hypothetical protein
MAALADWLGRTVRVGGLVVTVTDTGVAIDDGTATGELRLVGEAAALRPLLEPGDAVSASGRVVAGSTGPAVEVADPADLVRLGDLGEAVPITGGTAGGAGADPTGSDPGLDPAADGGSPLGVAAREAGRLGADGPITGEPAGDDPTGWTALALLITLAAGALGAVVAARRVHDRRRLAGRISDRLAAVLGTAPGVAPTGSPGRRGREHDPSVREPA